MLYGRRENGTSPTVDLNYNDEARLKLEALVDSAGLSNIVFVLARFASDRSKELDKQDPVTAECWGLRATALFICGEKINVRFPPDIERHNSASRTVGRVVRRLFNAFFDFMRQG